MILCLDVGNSQIFGGAFNGEDLSFTFRKSSQGTSSSDEFGLFLRSVIRENGQSPDDVRKIVLCSVVPDLVHSLRNACVKYFRLEPFVLQPGVKTGLKIRYRNPVEVGADRIANAVGGIEQFPNEDLLIIDFGTANTFCAVSAGKDFLGGVITPGLRISMEALESRTALLPTAEIRRPEQALGRSTIESIQSGLYFGTVGAVRELTLRLSEECFGGKRPKIVATGGFSSLFAGTGLFDVLIPNLVLLGLRKIITLNEQGS
jgi:type III pantothenate kinase